MQGEGNGRVIAPAKNRLALKGVNFIPWVRLWIERLKEKLAAAKQKN
jgi:hypothetical protein